MKLVFASQLKSIKDFSSEELPDFCVITGFNGSGKTQLLKALEGGQIQIYADDNLLNNRRYFDFTTLIPQDAVVMNPSVFDQERSNNWNAIFGNIQNHKNSLLQTLRTGAYENFLPDALKTKFSEKLDFEINLENFLIYYPEDEQTHGKKVFDQFFNNLNQVNDSLKASLSNDIALKKLINTLEIKTKKLFINIDKNSYFSNYPLTYGQIDVFQQSLSKIFTSYSKILMENSLKENAKNKGENVEFLSISEIEEKYGEPPWIFINKIFQRAGLKFEISSPNPYVAEDFEPILYKISNPDVIRFNELSSGEKILMSFALCVYNIDAQDKQTILQVPDLILFDEIDATLHPSMVKSVIDTIKEFLVEKLKIKVILTTHSPTTIALSPEDSIYVLENSSFRHNLKKTPKDGALTILSSGIPTLSINYENRRQIFVESEYDEGIYSEIYTKLRSYTSINLNLEISLVFIASGRGGQGNCEAVKHLVSNLNSNGRTNVFGIIDWDKERTSNGQILVISEGKRYALENLIFDPCLMAYFLVREQHIQLSEIGLSENDSHISFLDYPNEKVQDIVNLLLQKIKPTDTSDSDNINISCFYINGNQIGIPQWYLHYQGHDLEAKWKEIIPALNKYRREDEMKKKVISTAINEWTGYTPMEFVEIFKRIQG